MTGDENHARVEAAAEVLREAVLACQKAGEVHFQAILLAAARVTGELGADPALEGMACTFTALVLRGRRAHALHVGDSRLYRLREVA